MLKEVEMIASFDTEGTLRPHRLRLVSEDESLVVIKVVGILYEDINIAYKTIRYRCECVIQNKVRTVDLYYYIEKMMWYLDL
ncbi:MAG: hypothetical protein GX053_14810 [Tissierella sp.]|nr:hypothetical protein [Tissierella sp.]